jgi:hypothetical protein
VGFRWSPPPGSSSKSGFSQLPASIAGGNQVHKKRRVIDEACRNVDASITSRAAPLNQNNKTFSVLPRFYTSPQSLWFANHPKDPVNELSADL